jgi:hypothetical protein
MKPKRSGQLLISSVILFAVILSTSCASASVKAESGLPQYISPLRNAQYVSTGATIAVRYGPELTPQNAAALKFNVTGSKSGYHAGQTILADDHTTVIFKPAVKFNPGESVTVTINGIRLNSRSRFDPLSYKFTVATNQKPGGVGQPGNPPDEGPKSAFPDFMTLPQDIPHYTFQRSAPAAGDGDIFIAPFYWTKSVTGSYLLILNEQGQLVYYKSMADDQVGYDFKKQPNGLLSYFDFKNSVFHLMDSHYNETDTIGAGNGYTADLHDLQMLPNGNTLLMAYDDETVDMSQFAVGGKKDATVTGLIIQELDASKNVIFEWRSWDHFKITDTSSKLTDQKIDAVHGNSLALMNDGNLLLSSRNQSELTKINLQNGDVIWRLGGKANMFKFINGQPFAYQHDARQLPNGHITVFDNQGTMDKPAASHAMELVLDEANMTATVAWDFVHSPAVFATFMGNNQRLADGNTFITWGAASPSEGFEFVNITELDPNNKPLFEFAFDVPYVSYRGFIAPWRGFPTTTPDLAYKNVSDGIILGYSWNGATEVAKYQVYGGTSSTTMNFIEEKPKADFETQSHLAGLPAEECYFQVAALDKNNIEMARSKVISTDSVECP